MKNVVLKFFHEYLVYSTPLAVLVMLDGQFWPRVIPIGVIGQNIFSTIAGILFLVWLCALVIFLVRLVLNDEYRSACFKRLAGIHERDEREEMIVGRAAKSSFLFTLSALLILFFVSTWRYGERPSLGDAGRSYTIGHFDLTERSVQADISSDATFYPVPASKTALLALLIVLQVGSFRYFSRKSK